MSFDPQLFDEQAFGTMSIDGLFDGDIFDAAMFDAPGESGPVAAQFGGGFAMLEERRPPTIEDRIAQRHELGILRPDAVAEAPMVALADESVDQIELPRISQRELDAEIKRHFQLMKHNEEALAVILAIA